MNDDPSIRDNIERSVVAAHEALAQMERSLQTGRFMESLPAYRKMAEVLLAQRAWLGDGIGSADEAAFRRLGAVAGRLHEVLTAYASVMLRIQALAPQMAQAQVEEPVPEQPASPAQRVLSHLSAVPRTFTRLQSELAMTRRELERALEELERAELVSVLLQGGRQTVSRREPTDHRG